MEDHGGAPDERRDLLVVADVGALEIDLRANLFDVALRCRVSRLSMTTTRLAPFGKQLAYDGGADEARPSGDNVVAHD